MNNDSCSNVTHANGCKSLRVLHVVAAMDCGGAESRLMELMRHIDRQKIQFDFCVHKKRTGYYEPEIISRGGLVIRCGPLRNLPAFCWRFYRMLKRSNYDVVHSHTLTFSAVCMTLAKWARVKKRIAHFRTTKPCKKDSLLQRLINKLLINTILLNATDIIGNTRDVLKTWFGGQYINNPKIHLLYNGIDTSVFYCKPDRAWLKEKFNIPPKHKIVLHVGRFGPAKNHRKLIGIAQKYLNQNRNACFILVGDGILRPEMEALAKAKGILDKFRFVGVRDDVARIMKSADALLFPSAWEGLPGVILEAIAAGLPIVASALPGIREITEICGDATLLPAIAPDAEWAQALAMAVEKPHQLQWLDQIENSPFAVHNAWKNLLAVYSGR